MLESLVGKIRNRLKRHSWHVHALKRRKTALVGFFMILLIFFVAAFAEQLAPVDPMKQDLENALLPPSREHLFGTDGFGRDVMSNVIFGSRATLLVGVLAVGIGMLFGSVLGVTAGYFRGKVGGVIMRAMDVVLSFPMFLFALSLMAALGQNIANVVISIGIAFVPRFARIVYSSALKVREMEYIDAAVTLGGRNIDIIFRHVFPNCMGSIIVVATLNIANAILIESALSFLGVGVPVETPTWGAIASSGRLFIFSAPWMSVFSGLAIVIATLGFNLFGDGIRDVLDPRLRGETYV